MLLVGAKPLTLLPYVATVCSVKIALLVLLKINVIVAKPKTLLSAKTSNAPLKKVIVVIKLF
jgi:hypothetical protein